MPARLVLEIGGESVRIAECPDEHLCRVLEERGYLEGDRVDPWEAAFMLARCTATTVGGSCGWLDALRAAGLGGPPEMFFVYYDLRKRGRLVRRGVRKGTLLVVERGIARVEVKVLVEGAPISVGELVTWSRLAAADEKEPVVAIVSGHGEVTYYTARAVTSFH